MLEKAGIATVVVITAPFAAKARMEAGLFGVADLHLLALPHLVDRLPIGQATSQEVRRLAEASAGDVVARLAGATPVAAADQRP